MPPYWDDPDESEYEDEEEDVFGPGSPDYDLSEAHGYLWYPKREHWPVPAWLIAAVAIILVVALVLPSLVILLH